jgi:hypothetical protein
MMLYIVPGRGKLNCGVADIPNSSSPGCPAVVIAGLDPAIHVFRDTGKQDVDARAKRGHDAPFDFVIAGLDPTSSWPGLSRPSTSLSQESKTWMPKPGHDG